MKILLCAQNMQYQYYMKHNITDISHSTNCYKYKQKKPTQYNFMKRRMNKNVKKGQFIEWV